MDGKRAIEAVLVGSMGAGSAWLVLGIVDIRWLTVAGAVVGGLNGLISGAVGLYGWHRGKGWLFFVLDSTWGLLGNLLALVLHILNHVGGDPVYVNDTCSRTNRHVYEGGIGLRRGFALALGNVISNAGGSVGLRGESERVAKRRKFVVAHEGVHVLQNRLFGPLYQAIYVGWMAVFAVIGVLIWLLRERKDLGQIIETLAYYNNPFEYWAYRNDKYWPPKGVHPTYAWGGGKSDLA